MCSLQYCPSSLRYHTRLESDCTLEQVLQLSPGEPVCSDIFICRRSLIRISLTVFTLFFYKYGTMRIKPSFSPYAFNSFWFFSTLLPSSQRVIIIPPPTPTPTPTPIGWGVWGGGVTVIQWMFVVSEESHLTLYC